MAFTGKCVKRERDKSGNIIRYHIVAADGTQEMLDPNTLKHFMLTGSINITNLKLTKDGRIIQSEESGKSLYVEQAKTGLSTIPIYKRYSKMFELIGVDLVGAANIDAGDTLYNAINKKLGYIMRDPMMELPVLLLGNSCISGPGKDNRIQYRKSYNLFNEMVFNITRVIVLLHKDNDIVPCFFYEVEFYITSKRVKTSRTVPEYFFAIDNGTDGETFTVVPTTIKDKEKLAAIAKRICANTIDKGNACSRNGIKNIIKESYKYAKLLDAVENKL